MERRTFVKGAFGLMVLATGAGLVSYGVSEVQRQQVRFVTPEVTNPEFADGPVMQAGISLVDSDDGRVEAWAGDTHLFTVDALGAELIERADGSLTLDELARSGETELKPADVASFFVTLGQSGYLANTVMVNLIEIEA